MTPDKVKEFIAPLKKCAWDISRELEYKGEDEHGGSNHRGNQVPESPRLAVSVRRTSLKTHRVAGADPL
jgi:hypothetical protein